MQARENDLFAQLCKDDLFIMIMIMYVILFKLLLLSNKWIV